MIDALASRDDAGRVAVVAWNAAIDSTQANGNPLLDRHMTVELDGLEASAYRLRHRRVDREHSNLAADWAAMRGAAWPSDEQWGRLRTANRLAELEPERLVRPSDGALSLDFDLPMPAISLLELEPAA